MAATLMQPVHRPSMDHAASFDRQRSSVVAPFASSSYDRAPSPATAAARSRTSSSTSASPAPSPSPAMPAGYPQYYGPGNQFGAHQQAWGAAPVPATSFYAAPFNAFPNGPAAGVFQQGFQQSHPDFSAWAHVYQHMVAGGHMPPPGGLPAQTPAALPSHSSDDATRRRTTSGPSSPRAGSSHSDARANPPSPSKGTVQPQPFHPYKRGPTHRTSRDNMQRSTSQPSVSLSDLPKAPAPARGTPPPGADDHRRSTSIDTVTATSPVDEFAPPPRLRENRTSNRDRPSSMSSQHSSRDGRDQRPRSSSSSQRNGSPAVTPPSTTKASPATSSASKSTPLTSGAIATNAANAAQARPSPLSQAPSAPVVPDKGKSGGFLKNRLKTTLDRDAKATNSPTKAPATPSPVKQQPAAPATRVSRADPSAPRALAASGSTPLAPPTAPFANVQAMSSDVSLAETERTAATTASVATGKQKRGLFRMRNKSSDNISLSSTVSSASMMIRKMGSLGKLARRNSLMGISKIFKDKAKDEDAALPVKQGVLSFKKKSGKKGDISSPHKGDVAPAAVSRAYAELDRVSEEEDRVLSGLSPAAALARQHTVRSRAEAAKKAAEAKRAQEAAEAAAAELAGPSGEPTWDINTQKNRGAGLGSAESSVLASPNGPSVVHVIPRSPGGVVHAIAVNSEDYDSDDSSERDTMEDLTASMNKSSLAEDTEFQALWGQAHIDRNAQPKKSILKNCVSNEDLEGMANRSRSNSALAPVARSPGPMSDLPAPNPERIDGVAHAAHIDPSKDAPQSQYDPLSPDFSPFDSAPIELDYRPSAIYSQPAQNTSAPALSLATHQDPPRSMTAPVRRRLIWAPECAVYSTYDAGTYDRRSEPATCNRLTPELALAIKQELNAFKLEMPVHPSSRVYTHYFA